MSFYFSGPWGDMGSSTAGVTATPIRSRISIKNKGRVAGYEGTIASSATTGVTTAIGGTGVAVPPMTIACWSMPIGFNASSFGAMVTLSRESDRRTVTNEAYAWYEMRWFVTSNSLRPRIGVRRSATTTGATGPNGKWINITSTNGTIARNTWVHHVGTFGPTGTNALDMVCYVDGISGAKTTVPEAANPIGLASPNRTTIGALKVATSSSGGPAGAENNFSGYIAEVAIWNAVLTDAEIGSLYSGVPADRIRSANLVFYAPLIRDLNTVVGDYTLSPESGTTFTSLPVTGLTFNSPLYFAHPQTGITETHPRRYG